MTTRRHTIRFAAVGLAMSGLMALAACGGDDAGSSDTSTTAPVESPAAGGDPASPGDDDATDAVTDPAGGDVTETTFDTSDVKALSADECRALYNRLVGLGFDPSADTDPDDIDAVFEQVAKAVPGDLVDDVRVVQEAMKALSAATEGDQIDPTNPEFIEALEALDTPEFNESSARIEAYFSNCEAAVGD